MGIIGVSEPIYVGHNGAIVSLRVADGMTAITASMSWRAARWLARQLDECAGQVERFEDEQTRTTAPGATIRE